MDEALTKPRNVTHTLYKLYNWMQMGMIDLNPEFQRGTKQSHLIDSILKNFYVPPVIFSCKKLDNKRWLRVVIDGKQRLTSIRRFMDGEIPHTSPSEGGTSKKYYRSVSSNSRCLSDAERELFDCSELVCVEYYDLTLAQEQEIFSRVQLGVALTAAEKLQAISSPMADFAHNLYSTYPTLATIIDTRRGRPFQLITQSLHQIEHAPEVFRATPVVIQKFLKDEREVPVELRRVARRVYDMIVSMIEADAELFHRGHRLAPIEFVFLCWMIARFPGLSIAQYQHHLLGMKDYVRERHEDVRFNGKCYETLKRYLDELAYEVEDTQDTTPGYTEYAVADRRRKKMKIDASATK
ncbi:6762_t:CDS:2 [Paraglomus occultum]|uniref:6762_t:CDS:1 n=1 Tax=Paraglomus occultum TaxID=144539 RepID=A0A9N8VIK8_9GLOM|nr:6762_t:CDS:2 [Paraglomus occultum]